MNSECASVVEKVWSNCGRVSIKCGECERGVWTSAYVYVRRVRIGERTNVRTSVCW